MSKVLQGIRVLDFGRYIAGPFCGTLLGDMGAEVIMIERPGIGDPARQFPPLFRALNRGKRSVALDLKSAEGLARFRELAKVSDVIVEGFRPGKLAALGAGFGSGPAWHHRCPRQPGRGADAGYQPDLVVFPGKAEKCAPVQ